jgi:hypothetical protein
MLINGTVKAKTVGLFAYNFLVFIKVIAFHHNFNSIVQQINTIVMLLTKTSMQKAMRTVKLVRCFGLGASFALTATIIALGITVLVEGSEENMNFLDIHYFFDATQSPMKEINLVLISLGQWPIELFNVCFQVTYLSLCLHVDALYSIVIDQIASILDEKSCEVKLPAMLPAVSSKEEIKRKVYEKVFRGPSTSTFKPPEPVMVEDKSETLKKNIVQIIEAYAHMKKLISDIRETFIVIIFLSVMFDVFWLGYSLTNSSNKIDIAGFIATSPFFFFDIFLYCHGSVLLVRRVSIL